MMKRMILPAALFGALAAQSAVAADAAKGRTLHEAHCVKCHMGDHDDAFYNARKGKKLQNLASLNTMVQGCVTNFNLDWFEDDVANVAAYLDQTYYKFK
ncbi:MAG: cytochrome c [Pseudomonadota bacterium]